ncbi:hypothetical protein BDN72DRAFT_219495 [Pluteus cervinus]|uniref:Uncharacterized protein n=1 Tax=Pluteus cervinus TaxID=181527 RepID=A0ACD3AGG5_9AGAR|nr:hypothetical protein BDN72DRAFT_219495 [Pluteus cervinus]
MLAITQGPEAEGSNTQLTTLVMLPRELLLEILQELPHAELYRLAWTCRALHDAALTLIIEKYCPDVFTRGSLFIGTHHPTFLMPALHGFRFVNDFRSMTINLHGEIYLLFRDLRIVKDMISRMKADLQSFSLHFHAPSIASLGRGKAEYTDLEVLLERLREVLDLAIEKGCRTMSVRSDSHHGVRGLYTRPKTRIRHFISAPIPPIPPIQPIVIHKKESRFISKVWAKVTAPLRHKAHDMPPAPGM